MQEQVVEPASGSIEPVAKAIVEAGIISLFLGDLTPGLYIVNASNKSISFNQKVLISP